MRYTVWTLAVVMMVAFASAAQACETRTLNVNSAPIQGIVTAGTHAGTMNYSKPGLADATAVKLTVPATAVSNGVTYNFVSWTAPKGWSVEGTTVSGKIQGGDVTLKAEYAAPAVAEQPKILQPAQPVATPPPTTLTVNSSPMAGVAFTGTFAGTTNYSKSGLSAGTAVSLTAPATTVSGGTTYNFVRWTASAGWTVCGATVSGTMAVDASVNAEYAPAPVAVQLPQPTAPTPEHTLIVNSSPIQGMDIAGTFPGTANYSKSNMADGTAVTLTAPATDPAGYVFADWKVTAGGAAPAGTTDRSVKFTTSGITTAVAEYQPVTFALSVRSTPVKDVAVSSATGQGGATNYFLQGLPPGKSVTLTAPAADPANYTFVQWSVNQAAQTTGQKTISFKIGDTPITAIAEYLPMTCVLTVQSTPITGAVVASGSSNGDTTNYTQTVTGGSAINLRAPAADPTGYTFAQWKVNGAAQAAGQKEITFAISGPATAVAEYAPIMCALSVQSAPVKDAAISSRTGQSGTTGYDCQNLPYGSSVALAAPDADPASYVFVQWNLNGKPQKAGQKTLEFTINSTAMKAVAEYKLVAYALSVQSTPVAGVIVASSSANGCTTNSSQSVACGASVYLRAPTTDPAGYAFVQWKVNGSAQASGQKAVTFTMSDATTAVVEYRALQP